MNNLHHIKYLTATSILVLLIGFIVPVHAEQTEQSFTVSKRYNLVGQVTGVISPRPVAGAAFPAVRNTYNAQGLLQTVEAGSLSNFAGESISPSSWSGFTVFKRTTYTYDDLGRKLSERSLVLTAAASTTEASNAPALTAVTEYSYDDYGRANCVAKRLNGSLLGNACSLGSDIGYGPDRVTRYEYTPDNFGLIYKEFRAVGTIHHEQTYVTNTYDTYGRLTDQLDANNNRTHLEYNAQNRLETMHFPDKVTKNTYSLTDKEVYGYDNNGNRTSLLKRDGVNTITYKYDALNREIEKLIPTPADGSQNVYTSYDLLNLKTSVRFASTLGAGVTYKFDGFGELIEEQSNVTGTTYTVKNAYDKHSNRTDVTYNDNKVFTYTYDDLGRSKEILEGGVGSPVLIRNNFDSFGRISTQNTIGNVSTRLDYDKLSRPYSIAFSMNVAALNQNFKFKYNPVGQVVDETMTNDLYLYEEAGSKIGSYSVNNLNQYTGVGLQTYGHDKNGNLTCDGGYVESTQVCGTTKFIYDVENRLVSTAGTRNAILKYDPEGRLVQITSGGQTTNFQYNGDQMIAEYKNGVMQNRYIFGEGVDRPKISYSGSGVSATVRIFLHRNHQGSIVLATDTNGNGIYINTYDAYGVPGKANQGRFGYTGQMWIPEIGMYYYKARIYYPQIGRFLQTDPIGYADQMNMYAYVGNDPVNMMDPSGMMYRCGSTNDGPVSCEEVPGEDSKDSIGSEDGQEGGAGETGRRTTPGGPNPYREGGQDFFNDMFRVQYQYDALQGVYGDDAQQYARAADAVVTAAAYAYYTNPTIEYGGKSQGFRDAANTAAWNAIVDNKTYFLGRQVAQGLSVATILRLSSAGLAGKGSIWLGSTASFTTVGGYGRALNLIDAGVDDHVSIMGGALFGSY